MLSVRPARPEDAAAVAAVHVRSWQVGYRRLLPAAYLDALLPEDRVARYAFDAEDPRLPATLVASTGGAIRGFVTTGPARDADVPDAGEVLALYVDPPAGGLGVGRRLVAEARAQLGRRGFPGAVLWVLVGNTRAQDFYRADGWQAEDRRRNEELWGVTVAQARFRRDLP